MDLKETGAQIIIPNRQAARESAERDGYIMVRGDFITCTMQLVIPSGPLADQHHPLMAEFDLAGSPF